MRKICDFFENAKSPHSAVENCSHMRKDTHMHRNRIRSHVFNVIEIHRRREKNLQKKGLTSEVTTFISLYLKKKLVREKKRGKGGRIILLECGGRM